MFLIGGGAYSGTTLLTLLLNQGDLVCLDEPDFHDPAQRHRNIPYLRELFPSARLPPEPDGALEHADAVCLIEACERAIAPKRLGVKTCGPTFVSYARACRARGWTVVAILRDIRDALVRPLPDWMTEAVLNANYRAVWKARELYDLCVRYEDLVTDPPSTLARIGAVLGAPLRVREDWDRADVPVHMLKTEGHDGLHAGRIVDGRVGIWRSSGKVFTDESHATAQLMGYG